MTSLRAFQNEIDDIQSKKAIEIQRNASITSPTEKVSQAAKLQDEAPKPDASTATSSEDDDLNLIQVLKFSL